MLDCRGGVRTNDHDGLNTNWNGRHVQQAIEWLGLAEQAKYHQLAESGLSCASCTCKNDRFRRARWFFEPL